MRTRTFGLVVVSAALSAVGAETLWRYLPMTVPGRPDTTAQINFIIVALAFVGSFCASLIFVRKGDRSLAWACAFVLLADGFAVLMFSVFLLGKLAINVATTRPPQSVGQAALSVVLGPLAIRLTMNNVMGTLRPPMADD
ncbi:MAG TPA: hypothetical protein VGV37_09725 [Aliidongia sp.]|uniref:hypothetical protein n=1 Tax=Aliidongia sp. TaxID=1914230 RepID=UPI002DDCD6A4|nr:hypothetical protein [Aliidongia sp.]HEV2674810.1 hypothetical protein [Aliidongia sp.]